MHLTNPPARQLSGPFLIAAAFVVALVLFGPSQPASAKQLAGSLALAKLAIPMQQISGTLTISPSVGLTATTPVSLTVLLASPNPTTTNLLTGTVGPAITATTAVTVPAASSPLTATGPLTLPAALPSVGGGSAISATNPLTLPGAVDTSILPNGIDTSESSGMNTAGPGTEQPPTALPAPAVTAPNDSGSGLLLPIILGLIVLALAVGVFLFLRRPEETIPANPGLAPVKAEEVAKVDALAETKEMVQPEAIKPTAVAPAKSVVVPIAAPIVASMAAPEVVRPESVACSNCGTTNPINERYCLQCGNALAADKEKLLASLQSEAAPLTTTATAPAAVAAAPAVPAASALDLLDELLPYLETLNRAEEQLEYVLDRTNITIGRARTNDIVIDNSFVGWQTVSLYHAELRYQNGKFILVDKQSDNGSFVNRMRTGSNVLDDNMTISLGKVEFIYHQPGAAK